MDNSDFIKPTAPSEPDVNATPETAQAVEPPAAAPPPVESAAAPDESTPGQGEQKDGEADRKGPDWKAWGHNTWAFLRDPGDTPKLSERIINRCLDWARGFFSVEQFDSLAAGSVRYGHLALILAELFCVILGVVAAIRFDNWKLLPAGVGMGLLLVILQYTASRFLDAGRGLVENSPSRLASKAFPDCLALLAEVAGLTFFFSLAFRGDLGLFLVGLAGWALADGIAFVALHPDMINVKLGGDVHAGEEAIGILSFGIKTVIRIVPVAFAVGAVLGSIALVVGTLKLLGSDNPAGALGALRLLTFCLLLPFAGYIAFAFYHLTVDVLRAILVLPDKLDARGRT